MNEPIITNESQSLRWLKQIPDDLFRLDEKPLMGFPPAFNWDDFTSLLVKNLQLQSLSIKSDEWQWREQSELNAGFSSPLKWLQFAITPIEGSIWWVMPQAEIEDLIELLIIKETSPAPIDIDSDFITTFYRFLAVQALSNFKEVHPDKELYPSLMQDGVTPHEACLCKDISFDVGGKFFHGRLFLSPKFRKGWAHHYQASSLPLQAPIADSLETTIHLEIGKILLKASEWKSINPGDFVLLDRCSLGDIPENERVMLVISGAPFFQAKLHHGSLEILEHPSYYEDDTMSDQNDSQHDEKNKDLPADDDDTEFDFDKYLKDEENGSEELPKTENSQEHEPIISDVDIPNQELETEHQSAELPIEEHLDESLEEASTDDQNTPPSHLEDIPLPIVVEIGRIRMSIKQLLELQPGNMIDLNISPEAGVNLVVHEKRIGRGELIKLGDSLGIRILEIY